MGERQEVGGVGPLVDRSRAARTWPATSAFGISAISLESSPDLVSQLIDLQLDPCHPFHLNGQFAVNILNVPVHRRDKSLTALAAGGGFGAGRTLGTACARMSGCASRTRLTRQSSTAVRPRRPCRPWGTRDSPFTARPLFQFRHRFTLSNISSFLVGSIQKPDMFHDRPYVRREPVCITEVTP
jgi:hypothetical protein